MADPPADAPGPPADPPADAPGPPDAPTDGWSTTGEALALVFGRRHLSRTLPAAAVIGTALFAINQLDVVMNGDATARTWLKVAVTYVVPFLVANYGVLTATRRRTATPR